MTTNSILTALKRYGDKILAEEKARGILPAERELLKRMEAPHAVP